MRRSMALPCEVISEDGKINRRAAGSACGWTMIAS
jgi:hypothetical protein